MMIAQIMEHEPDEKEQETNTSFMPVIPRLDRLDRLLQLLEEKQSLSMRDHHLCASSLSESTENDERKTLSTALEEVLHKGTLMDRLALLENRVLQLSLEMDEGNTSKSSSSTVQVCSETTCKDSEVSNIPPNPDKIRLKDTSHVMQDAQVIQEQEGDSSSAVGVVTKRRAQQKISGGQRKKTQKKWLGLFRFPLMC